MEEETLLFIAIVSLFVILCTTVGVLLYVSGVTKDVEVGAGSPPIGKVTLAYKFATGPYNDAGIIFHEALKVAPLNTLTMGIYYDDPTKV